MKTCNKCKTPSLDFYKGQTCCKTCSKAASKKWKQNNQDKVKDYHLDNGYGIKIEEYNSMLAAQNGACKICLKPESSLDSRSKLPKKLAVDHCHKTGKVRGLLCYNCNRGIGLLKDDYDIVQRAAEYLK